MGNEAELVELARRFVAAENDSKQSQEAVDRAAAEHVRRVGAQSAVARQLSHACGFDERGVPASKVIAVDRATAVHCFFGICRTMSLVGEPSP